MCVCVSRCHTQLSCLLSQILTVPVLMVVCACSLSLSACVLLQFIAYSFLGEAQIPVKYVAIDFNVFNLKDLGYHPKVSV